MIVNFAVPPELIVWESSVGNILLSVSWSVIHWAEYFSIFTFQWVVQRPPVVIFTSVVSVSFESTGIVNPVLAVLPVTLAELI